MKKWLGMFMGAMGGFLLAQSIRHHRSAIEDFTRRGNISLDREPKNPRKLSNNTVKACHGCCEETYDD